MRTKTKLTTLAIGALLAGCAQVPQLTREQQLATHVRTYNDVSREEVIAAAERVLRLADEDDFRFSHHPEGFQAVRTWSVYLVLAASFGRDYWSVTTREGPNGVDVTAQVNTGAQAVTPQPTTAPGVWTATTGPMAGSPVQGTALYDLFWARMDYMLFKRNDWMPCNTAHDRVAAGSVFGNVEPLCNGFNVDDYTPGRPKTKLNARTNVSQQWWVPAAPSTAPLAADRVPLKSR